MQQDLRLHIYILSHSIARKHLGWQPSKQLKKDWYNFCRVFVIYDNKIMRNCKILFAANI